MGHVLSLTDRKGQATLYSYDALNRRALVSCADGSTVQSGYVPPTASPACPTPATASSAGATLAWTGSSPAVTPQASIGYIYDAAGRRTSMTAAAQAIVNYYDDNANRLTSLTQGSETVTFGYDAASELTGINYMSPTNTALGALTYGYELEGQRTS